MSGWSCLGRTLLGGNFPEPRVAVAAYDAREEIKPEFSLLAQFSCVLANLELSCSLKLWYFGICSILFLFELEAEERNTQLL